MLCQLFTYNTTYITYLWACEKSNQSPPYEKCTFAFVALLLFSSSATYCFLRLKSIVCFSYNSIRPDNPKENLKHMKEVPLKTKAEDKHID